MKLLRIIFILILIFFSFTFLQGEERRSSPEFLSELLISVLELLGGVVGGSGGILVGCLPCLPGLLNGGQGRFSVPFYHYLASAVLIPWTFHLGNALGVHAIGKLTKEGCFWSALKGSAIGSFIGAGIGSVIGIVGGTITGSIEKAFIYALLGGSIGYYLGAIPGAVIEYNRSKQ
jgi:hypothetical protein